METQRCKDCKYFYRHFVWSAGRFVKINEGHCVQEIKMKKSVCFADGSACEKFEAGEDAVKKIEQAEISLIKICEELRNLLNYIETLKN